MSDKPNLYQILSSNPERDSDRVTKEDGSSVVLEDKKIAKPLVYKVVEDKLIKIEWAMQGNDYVYQIEIRKQIFMDEFKNHNVLLAQMIRVLSPIIPRDIQVDMWAPNQFLPKYTIKVKNIAQRPMAQKVMETDVIRALLTMNLERKGESNGKTKEETKS
jgi:hypothetical protein